MRWKKLLLADDIDELLELERSFLQREAFELLVARTGHDVLMMISLERPDLVVLKLDLPIISGDDCCKRIKLNDDLHGVPVILVVPGNDDDALRRCYEACCDDYLIQPINHQQVVEKAARFLSVPLRAEPRVATRLSIRYGIGDQQTLTNFSVNLSRGGVFIETDKILPIDTLLTMEFTLPDSGRQVSCRGRVAWVNALGEMVTSRLPSGIGVQFHGLGIDELHALRDYIHRISPQPNW